MLMVAFGTRPELLKIEPLLKYWKSIGFNDYDVFLTGQHQELCFNLSKEWEFKNKVKWLTWPNYDDLNIKNRLDHIVAEIIRYSDFHIFEKEEPTKYDHILVQGDTASAFACALAAFHRKIPIIHLEAGLRSFDNENPYPEEAYRRMVSAMSSYNLCPTWNNAKNLEDEKMPGQNFVVGNTILDSLDSLGKDALFENKILITLHRRENLSEMEEWFDVVEKLASQCPDHEFILPIHKNPEIYKLKSKFKHVKCVDPLPHDELVDLLSRCKYVITDSGGLCEEATWFGKRIFLCRRQTERPEAWQFYIKSPTPNDLYKNFHKEMSFNIKDNLKIGSPFGDGRSCEEIHSILLKLNIISA